LVTVPTVIKGWSNIYGPAGSTRTRLTFRCGRRHWFAGRRLQVPGNLDERNLGRADSVSWYEPYYDVRSLLLTPFRAMVFRLGYLEIAIFVAFSRPPLKKIRVNPSRN